MSFPIDDKIKASLATLELVKYSVALSEQEVESAKRNLNQLALLVESITQNLPESIINDDIESIVRCSSNEMQQILLAPSDSSHGIEKDAIDENDIEKTPEINKQVSDDLTITPPPSNDCVVEESDGGRVQFLTDDSTKSIEPSSRRLPAPFLMPMNEEGFGVSIFR